MLNKVVDNVEAAVKDIESGAVLHVGGFGLAGQPIHLLEALLHKGCKNLTIINNNAGPGDRGIGARMKAGAVSRRICTLPAGKDMYNFKARYKAGEIELELVPQGTFAERIRCAAAGLGGFLTPTGVGLEFTEGKTICEVDGRQFLLEKPLPADFALVRAHRADRWGNLVYRYAMRNFNPVMAQAGPVTVAEVEALVELGEIAPDQVHTPSVYVHRVYPIPREGA